MTIHTIQDLLDYFLASSPASLNKKVNKYITCGASISFYLQDGTVLHPGDKWPRVREIEEIGLKGFSIQTIIMGQHMVGPLFSLPIASKAIDDWMNTMEVTAEWILEQEGDSVDNTEEED